MASEEMLLSYLCYNYANHVIKMFVRFVYVEPFLLIYCTFKEQGTTVFRGLNLYVLIFPSG